jgi:VWFA-related protein
MQQVAVLLLFGSFATPGGSPGRAGSVADKPPAVIRISVEGIQLDAVVTDKSGRHVTDLTPAEVEVFQDGELQAISGFAYVRSGTAALGTAAPEASRPGGPAPPPAPAATTLPGAPRTLLVVLDDLSFNAHAFDRTRRALEELIPRLAPADRVDIVTTSAGFETITLTTDRAANLAALEAVRRTPWTRGELAAAWASPQAAFFGRMHGARYDGNVFDNVDDWMALQSLAILKGAVKALREVPGRKAILLVSQGLNNLRDLTMPQVREIYWPLDRLYGDSNSLFGALRRLAELGARSGVVIHTLDPRGLVAAGVTVEDSISDIHDVRAYANLASARHVGLQGAQSTLQYLSDETGGLALVDGNDLGGSLAAIVDDLSGYYLIGYSPRAGTFDSSRFHRFEVKVKRKGLKVRTREGFYPVTDQEVAAALQ